MTLAPEAHLQQTAPCAIILSINETRMQMMNVRFGLTLALLLAGLLREGSYRRVGERQG